jgi:hypothetical protein
MKGSVRTMVSHPKPPYELNEIQQYIMFGHISIICLALLCNVFEDDGDSVKAY